MVTQTRSREQGQSGTHPDYTYEYCLIDPVTKGTYLLRTKRPKIRDQIEFHIKLALSGRKRVQTGEKVILYALEK
jgi:hypothetical protein